MARREPFNWSLLDRSSLYCMLNSLQGQIVNKKLSVAQLQRTLARHIKYYLPIKVSLIRNSKNKKDIVYIGGCYYSDLDKKNRVTPVEIVFSYHTEQTHLKITRYRWVRMCSLFADTVLHEIIHMRQYRSRNFKSIPGYASAAYYAKDRRQQEYYGHSDEIGAFSYNIACDLTNRFGYDIKAIQKYMDGSDYKRHKNSSYYDYLKTFNFNQNHKVIKRMKKKVLSQIDNAIFGKPFRTSDHLTY